MAFMVPEYEHGTFFEVETSAGSFLVPGHAVGKRPTIKDFSDYVPEGRPESFERVKGYFARLSAPGYMDRTDWSGPFETLEEAKAYIEEFYEVDPETGDELEENPGGASLSPSETRKIKNRILKE